MAEDIDQLLESIAQRSGPAPRERRDRPVGRIDIRIQRDGQWFYRGTPIARREMVLLFAEGLFAKDGSYFLSAPEQILRIEVEDLPFIIIDIEVAGRGDKQQLTALSNCEHRVVIGAEHPLQLLPVGKPDSSQSGDKQSQTKSDDYALPAVLIRDDLYARLSRNCYYQLAELAETVTVDGKQELHIRSAGKSFSLGSI